MASSRPIDEKIVAMKMDNSDLLAKAAETTTIFGKIKDALGKIPGVDIGKVAQSFGEIQSAAQKVDLTSISDNVEKIAGRFSNLGVVAMTTLANITNKAVDAGLQLLKSFTVQPILDGFHEYETKIGAIGTVLSNTEWAGTKLDDVKRVLGDLNNYADNTIYDFGQMTENIGRFTAAGVRIDDAATAIKGLGNLAAISGSNTEQLNTVMYQMSQALAAGKLNLMDWNSLVNGGMAGKKTQDALVATARAMGMNVDLSDGFRNSIQQGWLTSEVFLATLKKFGADQSMTEAATKVRTFTQMIGSLKEGIGSGWATTFELIFGDFNQATEMWSGLYKTIGGILNIFDNARNNTFKAFADAGVFKGFFDIIIKGGDAVLKIFTAIGDGISKAFSGTHSDLLNMLGRGLEKFANALTPSEATLKSISIIFQALFTPISLVVNILLTLGKVLIEVIKIPLELIGLALYGIIKVIGFVVTGIAKLVVAFSDAVKSGKDLSDKLTGIKAVFSKVGSWVGRGIKAIGDFGNAIKEVWNFLKTGDASQIGPWADKYGIIDKLTKMRETVKTFVKGVKQAWDVLTKGSFDSNAGPFGANSKTIERLLALRETVKKVVAEIGQAWNIFANGKYVDGPWDKDSEIVRKIIKIRAAVEEFTAGIRAAWNILATGKNIGGPWDDDSRIVKALLTIRKTAIDVANNIVEAWHILTTGEITKGGPWGAESEIVAKLMSIRNTAIEMVTSIKEAWSVLTSGKVLADGPWKAGDTIVKALLTIRDGIELAGKALLAPIGLLVYLWEYLTKSSVPSIKGPWDNKAIENWMTGVKSRLGELGDGFLNFGGAIAQAWSILSKGVDIKGPWSDTSYIVTGLHKVRDACIEVGKYLASLHLSLDPVANAFKDFFKSIGDGFNWLKEKLSEIGKKIADSMPSGQKLLAGGFMAAMITVAGFVLKFWMDIAKGMKGWMELGGTLKETLGNIGDAFDSFSKTMKTNNTVAIIVALAVAVGALALAIKLLSTIDQAKMTTSLIALTTVLAGIVGAMAIITKYDITGTGMKATIQLMGLGIAVLILVTALKRLSELNLAEIGTGIIGLVGIMGTLSGALILMSKFGGKQLGVSAIQFLMLASAVLVMVDAVRELGKMKPEVLKQGLTTLGFILIELGLFFAMIGHTSFGIGDALAFLAIARAIDQIVFAIEQIGKIKVDVLKQGLTTIGFILVEIALFTQLTKETGLLSTAVGLLLVSAALTALLIPITLMGSLPYQVINRGLTDMGLALGIIAGMSILMSMTGTSLLGLGAGLILLAVAMNMLLPPIISLGVLPFDTTAKGIMALGLGLAVIGGVAALLGLASEFILAFGVALLVVGAAMLIAGAGMSLFSAGLVSLATMTSASVTAIVATLGTIIAGLAAMMPQIINWVANTIVQIVQAIAVRVPTITAAIATMLVAFLNTIASYIPQIVEAAVKIITNFLDALAKNIPKIVDSAVKLVVAFIDGLSSAVDANGPKFINSIMQLMGEVLILVVEAGVAVVQALFGWIPGVTDATNKIGKGAEKAIRDSFGAKQAGTDKGKDFADGVGSKSGDAKNSGNKIGNSARDGASAIDLATVGNLKGFDFAKGLGNNSGNAHSAGTNVANSGKSGAGSVDMSSTGSWFGQGFADGISSKSGAVARAASNLATKAKSAIEWLLHINSPSRVMKEIGGWFGEGFAIGIDDTNKMVGKSAEGLASTAKDSVNEFIDAFELPVQDNEIHFKAVVDYDQLDASKFGSVAPVTIRPDTSLTSGLVTATKAELSQNGNNNPSSVDNSSSTVINQQVDLKVEAKGYSTRSEIKKLAVMIQDELKSLDDRTKISRGEGVAF
jgi:tape measure domain-containing protein